MQLSLLLPFAVVLQHPEIQLFIMKSGNKWQAIGCVTIVLGYCDSVCYILLSTWHCCLCLKLLIDAVSLDVVHTHPAYFFLHIVALLPLANLHHPLICALSIILIFSLMPFGLAAFSYANPLILFRVSFFKLCPLFRKAYGV